LPVRHRQGFGRRISARIAIPATVGPLVAVVVAVSLLTPDAAIDFDEAARKQQELISAQSGPPPSIDVKDPDPPFPRIAVFGDSTGFMTGYGLAAWSQKTNQAVTTGGGAEMGCGVGRGGERRDKDTVRELSPECNRWVTRWEQLLARFNPNIALVQIGPWETADRKLQGDDTWRALGDPVYDKYLLEEMTQAVDTLSAKGAMVMWLTAPLIGTNEYGQEPTVHRGPAGRPERMQRLNELIAQLPGLRPGKVRIIDLAAWLETTGEDQRLRPDGVHFTEKTGAEVAERFLGGAVIDEFKEAWKERVEREKNGGPDPATPPVSRGDDIYVDTRRVLVVGDAGAEGLNGALQQVAGSVGGLEIIAARPTRCGSFNTGVLRRPGATEPEQTFCPSAAYGVLQQAIKEKVDYVLVVPSALDVADASLTRGGALSGWGDPAFDEEAATQLRSITNAFNQNHIIVAWVSPTASPPLDGPGSAPASPPASPQGPPTTTPTGMPPGEVDRREAYDQALVKLEGEHAGKFGFRRIDLGRFVKESGQQEPIMDRSGAITEAAASDVATWLRLELLTMYDEYLFAGAKIHPPGYRLRR
jgi:hypothetical protein